MKRTEHALRREVAAISSVLWDRGWVANHDGNVTAKAAPGRIVATPTALSKRQCEESELIVVDESARVVSGRRRAFSELGLHLAIYQARPDVGAVVHAHPPYATARATSACELRCFLPEAVVSLGELVPLVPLSMPGKDAEAALGAVAAAHDAALLESHGVFAWGDDPEQAFLRLELVEHLSRIAHIAHATGGPKALPKPIVDKMLEARTKAGLGPAARKTR